MGSTGSQLHARLPEGFAVISVLLLATTLDVPVHAGPDASVPAPAMIAVSAEGPSVSAAPALAPLPHAADSSRILRDARWAQEDCERFRETRIPAEMRQGGRCDEPMGRLCLNYGA
ncbi:hypothetical protein BH23GEM11_BH23GEM11_16820 [soil metagenome]